MPYLGNTPSTSFATIVKDTFDGGSTGYTLSKVATTNSVSVFVENVRQEPTSAYSVSGTTLTFTATTPSGTGNIYVLHMNPTTTTTHPAAQALTATTGTFTSTVDINGNELILDADADSSITADTDDQIDFRTGGTDRMSIKNTGQIFIGNTSGTLPSGTMGVGSAGRHIIANDGAGFLLLQDNSTAAQNNGFDIHMGGVPAGTATYFSGGSIGGFVENSSDADGYLKFSTSVNGTITEAMRINSDGNLVIAQSGKGIDFSNNTGSSASGATVQSELLDYYEEGTWTPTFYLGLSAQSWNQQYGHYIRIGQKVTVTFWLLGNSSGNTSDGNGMVIQGLPFNVGTSSSAGSHAYTRGHGVVNYIDFGSTNGAVTLYGYNDLDRMSLGYDSGRTAFTAGSNGAAANSSYAIGGFTYFTGSF